jgi:hypothetical protein
VAKNNKQNEIELNAVRLEVVIEASFDIDKFDNGSDIDRAIEEALDSLKGLGSAEITRRSMFGVPRSKR